MAYVPEHRVLQYGTADDVIQQSRYRQNQSNRPAKLSITHILRAQLEAEFDVGQSHHAELHDHVAGRIVARTREVATRFGELGQEILQSCSADRHAEHDQYAVLHFNSSRVQKLIADNPSGNPSVVTARLERSHVASKCPASISASLTRSLSRKRDAAFVFVQSWHASGIDPYITRPIESRINK
jgi:hypothetical protein